GFDRHFDDIDYRLGYSQHLDVLHERLHKERALRFAAFRVRRVTLELDVVEHHDIDVVSGKHQSAGVLHVIRRNRETALALRDDERQRTAQAAIHADDLGGHHLFAGYEREPR